MSSSLYWIISIFLIVFVFSLFLGRRSNKKTNLYQYQYKKSKVMTKTEREIFNFIKNRLEPKGYLVLAQVRLADFVSVCDVKYKSKLWFFYLTK